jgi:hypothetical protein
MSRSLFQREPSQIVRSRGATGARGTQAMHQNLRARQDLNLRPSAPELEPDNILQTSDKRDLQGDHDFT